MELTTEVKNHVLKANIQLVGITPVDRLAAAPVGRRPTDILPTASTVIVCAVHVLEGTWGNIVGKDSGNVFSSSL